VSGFLGTAEARRVHLSKRTSVSRHEAVTRDADPLFIPGAIFLLVIAGSRCARASVSLSLHRNFNNQPSLERSIMQVSIMYM